MIGRGRRKGYPSLPLLLLRGHEAKPLKEVVASNILLGEHRAGDPSHSK